MYITALDIGSNQIKILVTEIDGEKSSLLGVVKIPSAGVRRGEVICLEDIIHSLSAAVGEIKKVDKAALKNIFVNINGANVKIQASRGIVAVSRADSEIYEEDIDRVIKASQAINIDLNRTIIHTLTTEFVVDGIGDIGDALGMIGSRLEVNSLIVDAFKPTINNVIKTVEVSGGKLGGLIYNPLAAQKSVLSKIQKELGTVMIDIGFGTTGISVYEENKLLQAAVFPIGISHIINDLAIGLKCSIKTAEAVNLTFGSAMPKDVSTKEKIELNQIDESLNFSVSRRFVAEIIESRLAEIFELVNNKLKSINRFGKLPAGAIITGGGAKIPGVIDLVKQELKLPSQIGVPSLMEMGILDSEKDGKIGDPEFAVAAGLILWGREQLLKNKGWNVSQNKFVTKILKNFMP